MGAALAAPRLALAAADREEAAGKAGSDVALLIALYFVAGHLRELVVSLWLGRDVGLGQGASTLVTALAHAIAYDLIGLFAASVLLTIAAGRKRSIGRDFDLACVAFIPYLTVKIAATIFFELWGTPPLMIARGVRVVAFGWTFAVLLLAWQQARSRPGEAAPAAPARPPVVAWGGRALALALAGLFAMQLVWVVGHRSVLRPILPGDVAPGFRLPRMSHDGTLTGEALSLDQLEGKVVLLDFWANWCKPCRDTIPHVEQIYRRYHDRGLEVVSIKLDGLDLDKAGVVIAKTTFPIVVDATGEISDAYKVSTIPHLVLIDRLGVVRFVHHGGITAGALAPQVERLLERAKP